MLAAVIGVVFGYMMTTYCIAKYTWQFSYYFQLCLYVVALIPFMFIPRKYVDVDQEISR